MTALPEKRLYTMEDIENLPEGQRAELINGDLYMFASPARIHQRISYQLSRIIGNYIESNNGNCEVYPAPFAVRLFADDKTYVEPDISIICDSDKLSNRGCEGAPDWIIEVVSPSSIEQDYYRKLGLYQAAGVREYWIINPDTEKVTVYIFPTQYGYYNFSDSIPVSIYPGFSIKVSDLL